MKNRKTVSCVFLFFFVWMAAYAQEKQTLAILPFTGLSNGNTPAIFLESDIGRKGIYNVFPVSRMREIMDESSFQEAGLTGQDGLIRLSTVLWQRHGVTAIALGRAVTLGSKKLLIITIINPKTLEQIAGTYDEYAQEQEIEKLIPVLAQRLSNVSTRTGGGAYQIAIRPFTVESGGVSQRDADTLAQLLACEITNTGRYKVLPRTQEVEGVLREMEERQLYGQRPDAAKLGEWINPDYLLAGKILNYEESRFFDIQMIDLKNTTIQENSGRKRYAEIEDGLLLMREFAKEFTGIAGEERRQKDIIDNANKLRESIFFDGGRKFWSLGLSAGTSFATPGLIGTVYAAIAPFPYSYLDIGCDFGFLSETKGVESYWSYYPFVHYNLFLPFRNRGGWHIGAGAGWMNAEYTFPEGRVTFSLITMDITAGINLFNMVDVSYTLRTNFDSVNQKLSLGYTFRIK